MLQSIASKMTKLRQKHCKCLYHLTLVSLVAPSMVEVAEEDNDEDDAHDDADDDDDPELQLRQPSCQHRF